MRSLVASLSNVCRSPSSRRVRISCIAAMAGMMVGCSGVQVPEVQIMPRTQWAEKEPMLERLVEHTPRRLTIHHAGVLDKGTVAGDEKMRRLFRFSVNQKPWGDVPYHFVIDRSGVIWEARALKFAPDTNTGYDVDSHICICVNGDLTKQPLLENQYRSLVGLLIKLSADLDIPDKNIAGHMDVSPGNTTCPGLLETYIKNGWLVEDMRRVRAGGLYPFRTIISSGVGAKK